MIDDYGKIHYIKCVRQCYTLKYQKEGIEKNEIVYH